MNKLVLFLVTIVLLAVAGFALLWFTVGGGLEERSDVLMRACWEGRSAEVHAQAAPEFRAGRTPEQFAAYLAHWTERRGAFRSIARRRQVSTRRHDGQTVKTVDLDLGFERGPLQGALAFVEDGGELALLHLSLREPPTAVERTDTDAMDREARALFDAFSEGAFVALYARLAPALQRAWPPRVLQEQLGKLRTAAGSIAPDFRRRESTDVGELSTVVYELAFERGAGSATVQRAWVSDHWEIVTFVLRVGS